MTCLQGCHSRSYRLSGRPACCRPVVQALNMRCGASASQRTLLALDFDGVICDSCGESSLTAWKAACHLWPKEFESRVAFQRKAHILEQMRLVRPVVETGYENIVQIRALLEGTPTDDILQHWNTILPAKMQEWGVKRADLVDLFGRTRDEWMAQDLDGWLAPNRIYADVDVALKSAMQSKQYEIYIVTTKQARFTKALLKEMANIDFDMDRIYSQTVSGEPKTEVLESLQRRHDDCSHFFFVEDKLATLEKVTSDDRLSGYRLFLVDWGYNTDCERLSAKEHNRIELINRDAFAALLTA